ncbi:hypothetical protein BH09SUM1_BH09SUM1_33470 [soil metagenome]
MKRFPVAPLFAALLASALFSAPSHAIAQLSTNDAITSSTSTDPVAILQDEAMSLEERAARLQDLANASPDSAEAWTAYGEILEKQNQDARALLAFDKASQIDPHLYTPWLWICIIAKRGAPEPDLPRAETALRTALAAGAPKARTLNELGVTLSLSNRMKESADTWKQAIAEDPDWGVLYNNLLKAATKLDDEGLARQQIAGAITAKRFEESAIMQYGEYMIAHKKYDAAIDGYRRALEAHPDNARIRYYYGVALGESGDRDEALIQLSKARDQAASSATPGDVAEASEWAVFGLRYPKEEKKFQEARGLVFTKVENSADMAKNLRRAISTLDPIVEKHPDFWNALFVRGVAHRRLNEPEAAAKDYEKVLSLYSNEPNTTMELALLKRDAHDFAGSAELAAKAVELAPKDPAFAMNAGFIFLDADRCEAAWDQYRRALRMVGEQNSAPLKDELDIRCKP